MDTCSDSATRCCQALRRSGSIHWRKEGGGHGSGVKTSPARHPALTESCFPTRNCVRRDSPLTSTAADPAGGESGPVRSPGTGRSRDPPGHTRPRHLAITPTGALLTARRPQCCEEGWPWDSGKQVRYLTHARSRPRALGGQPVVSGALWLASSSWTRPSACASSACRLL